MAKKPSKQHENDEEAEFERAKAEEREQRERQAHEQQGQHPEDRGPPVRSAHQQRPADGHPLGSRNGTGGQHGQQA